jgi:hypothetical protein
MNLLTNFLHEIGKGNIQRMYFHFQSQVFFIVVVVNDHEAQKGILKTIW